MSVHADLAAAAAIYRHKSESLTVDSDVDSFIEKEKASILADRELVAKLLTDYWTMHPVTVGRIVAHMTSENEILSKAAHCELADLAGRLAETEAKTRWNRI